jgi:hypothetical protein
LDYVPPETELMEDPSVFICYARSERRIPIPGQIIAKVSESDSSLLLVDTSQHSVFLSCYLISVSVEGYTYGEGTGEYEAYASDDDTSTSSVVSPAECYISSAVVDTALVRTLSEMVVMTVREGTPLMDFENIETIFEGMVFMRVKVRKLSGSSYLLSVSYPPASCSLFTTVSGLLGREIRSGSVVLQQWTPCFGSIGTAMFSSAELSLRGLPCNFCTPVIIEYILSPFCLVNEHHTVPNTAEGAIFGDSVVSYKCSVWFEELWRIPRRLRIKSIPLVLADTRVLSSQEIVMLRAMDVSIAARIN